jgi:hypothetical protein
MSVEQSLDFITSTRQIRQTEKAFALKALIDLHQKHPEHYQDPHAFLTN